MIDHIDLATRQLKKKYFIAFFITKHIFHTTLQLRFNIIMPPEQIKIDRFNMVKMPDALKSLNSQVSW
jgi:hypothetical protein